MAKKTTVREKPVFKRILLKVSGEGLVGDQGYGIDHGRLLQYGREILSIHQMGVDNVGFLLFQKADDF